MSYLRYYDESVISYFKNINYSNSIDVEITPQILFAVPSRKGVKLNVNPENITPILPMICVTPTGLNPTNETNIIKSRVTRPIVFDKDISDIFYSGFELMPYNINYQVDTFSLLQDEHNSIKEVLLYKLHKHNCIKVEIEISNTNFYTNAYIHNISNTDSSSYTEVPDTSERLFHNSFTFSLYGFIINDERATKSVLDIRCSIESIDETDV